MTDESAGVRKARYAEYSVAIIGGFNPVAMLSRLQQALADLGPDVEEEPEVEMLLHTGVCAIDFCGDYPENPNRLGHEKEED